MVPGWRGTRTDSPTTPESGCPPGPDPRPRAPGPACPPHCPPSWCPYRAGPGGGAAGSGETRQTAAHCSIGGVVSGGGQRRHSDTAALAARQARVGSPPPQAPCEAQSRAPLSVSTCGSVDRPGTVHHCAVRKTRPLSLQFRKFSRLLKDWLARNSPTLKFSKGIPAGTQRISAHLSLWRLGGMAKL